MIPPSESAVLDALRPIIDPDFGKSIVDLGFIKDLRIDGARVSFSIELTTPACPVKEEFERAARERVLALEGVDDVAVTMTANTRGRVLDADVYGPSLPLLTGVQGRPRAEEKRIHPHEAAGLKLMSMGFFLSDDSPVIWRGPMVHGLIRQFLTDVIWGDLDYLVVDMPPGTGDAALTLTQMAPLSGAVIVTTANNLSLIDARKGLAMFEKVQVPVLGIIENMSYFTPPDLPDRKYHIFGEGGARRTAEELGVDFLGEVPIDPRIVEGGDAGRPIVVDAPESPAAQAFEALAGSVARKLAVLAESIPPIADANITWVS